MNDKRSLGKGLSALFSEKGGEVKLLPRVKDYLELEQMYLSRKEKLMNMEEKLRKTKELIFLKSVMGTEVDEEELRALEMEIRKAKEELETVKMGLIKIKEDLRTRGILDVLTKEQIELISEIEADLMKGVDTSIQLINKQNIPEAREREHAEEQALSAVIEDLKPAEKKEMGEVKEKIIGDLEGILKPELLETFQKIENVLASLKSEMGDEEGSESISAPEEVTLEEIREEEEMGEVDIRALKEEIHPEAVSRRVAREVGLPRGKVEEDLEDGEGHLDLGGELPEEDLGQVELIRRALQLIREGRDKEAERILLHYVKIEPLSPWIWYHLGGIYYLRGDYPRAKSAFQKAINAKPGNKYILLRLADVYTKLRLNAEALKTIKSILEKDPKNYRALTLAGEVFLYNGRYQKAKKYLKSALRWNPTYERAVKDMVLIEKLEGEST